MNETRVLAAAVLLWAGLWTLLAAAQPPLPVASERHHDTALAHRQRLAEPLQQAVAQRLAAPGAVELTELETLRLRPDAAEVRFLGLLHGERGPRALLAVDAELDRKSLQPRQFQVQLHEEPASPPRLAALQP
jgi:hypothetical protein